MMQPREKILLASVLVLASAWLGGGYVMSAVFEPFQVRIQRLDTLRASVNKKTDDRMALERAKLMLKNISAISLPPDPGKSKQPTALNAQRLYVEWLTDIAELCGFDDPKVLPGNLVTKGKVYISVGAKVEANARYEQLVKFLDVFYRTSLAQRISALNVTTKVFEGDPVLTIKLDAEGLVMLDTPSRRTLFPQTMLAEPISEDGKLLQVVDGNDFPNEPGFRVLLKSEFLQVTEIHDDNFWAVERGIEQTQPAASTEGAFVDLVRMKPGQTDRTMEELRQLVIRDIFMKPSPPYKVKWGTLAERTVLRGKSLDFTIPVLGYDSSKGKPEFSLVESPVPGLKIDKKGKVSWKPDNEADTGKYTIKFEARHASIPKGTLEGTFTVNFREPRPAPVLTKATPPVVFLNREWKYRPPLVPTGTTPPRYNWRLGDKSPAGLKINDRTGELTWIPGDEIPVGDTTIPLIATDNDSPPQSTTLNLKVDVEDDAAQFTRLTGIFAIGDKKRLFLFDPSTEKKTELHVGDKFSISNLSGTIKEISKNYAILSLNQQDIRWELGQSLREAEAKIKDD